jgi:hypothetical protein
MTLIERTRRTLALLEAHGLDTIEDIFINASYGSLNIECRRSNVTEKNMRAIKRLFGPLAVKDEYSGKSLTGKMLIEDEEPVTMTVSGCYACRKLTPDEMTEEKLDDIVTKLKTGLVTIEDCNPVDGFKLEDDV